MAKIYFSAAVLSEAKQNALEKMEMHRKNVKNGFEKQSSQVRYELNKVFADNVDIVEASSGYAMEYDDTGVTMPSSKLEEEFEQALDDKKKIKSESPQA